MVVEWFLETIRENQVFGSFKRQKWRKVKETEATIMKVEKEKKMMQNSGFLETFKKIFVKRKK